MTDALQVVINGRESTIEEAPTPSKLSLVLERLALRADRIAVELNGELAPRTQWEQIEVSSGDRLEIVHFVGGGQA